MQQTIDLPCKSGKFFKVSRGIHDCPSLEVGEWIVQSVRIREGRVLGLDVERTLLGAEDFTAEF